MWRLLEENRRSAAAAKIAVPDPEQIDLHRVVPMDRRARPTKRVRPTIGISLSQRYL